MNKSKHDAPTITKILRNTTVAFALPIAVGLGTLSLAGCSGGPSRLTAPSWDAESMSEQAIVDFDKDADGLLSTEELDAAPGLKYNARQLDTDRDGLLSREEIQARIARYQKMGVGLTPFSCNVLLNNRPLVGAKVRLVPESFLGEVVQPQESVSKERGMVTFTAEGVNMSVVPVCMYRVEITSSEVSLPAKYNTATILGVEVSAMTDPDHPSAVVFRLEHK